MELIQQIITALDGKKTYSAGAALIVYAVGAKFGLWPKDMEIIATMLALQLIALRAGVKKTEIIPATLEETGQTATGSVDQKSAI